MQFKSWNQDFKDVQHNANAFVLHLPLICYWIFFCNETFLFLHFSCHLLPKLPISANTAVSEPIMKCRNFKSRILQNMAPGAVFCKTTFFIPLTLSSWARILSHVICQDPFSNFIALCDWLGCSLYSRDQPLKKWNVYLENSAMCSCKKCKKEWACKLLCIRRASWCGSSQRQFHRDTALLQLVLGHTLGQITHFVKLNARSLPIWKETFHLCSNSDSCKCACQSLTHCYLSWFPPVEDFHSWYFSVLQARTRKLTGFEHRSGVPFHVGKASTYK